MRDDASPRAPTRVFATLCVAVLFAGACQADDPVVVSGPDLAKPIGFGCTDESKLQTGTAPLTVRAFDGQNPVNGFTASVFNKCGLIRVLQAPANSNEVVFQGPGVGFASNAQVFVMAQGGITEDGARLNIAPAASSTGLDLNFIGTPRNRARITLAGPGNTIVSAVPTFANLQAAVQGLAVSVKNSGTTVDMQLPQTPDSAVREVITYNLANEAPLPIAALQILDGPNDPCALFPEAIDPLCATSEGLAVMRGVDVLEHPDTLALLVTSLYDPEVDDEDCVIELLALTDTQGLLNASADCTDGVDTDGNGIKEIALFAEPAFCSLDATVYEQDTFGDGGDWDFLDVRVGAVAIGTYPGGTFPNPLSTALTGTALMLPGQTVTLTVTVKEFPPAGGATVRNDNIEVVATASTATCTSQSANIQAYCLVDPDGYAGAPDKLLVRWTALVSALTEDAMREFSLDIKGQDAIPDATKNEGARVMIPADPATVMGVCPVEFGGGRFSPIG